MSSAIIPSRGGRHGKAGKRASRLFPCFAVVALLALAACHSESVEKLSPLPSATPQQALDSVHVVRSTGGRRQMVLSAQRVMVFGKPERMTVYPDGVFMQLFDGVDSLVADIRADSAVSLDDKHEIRAYGNVKAVDYRTGDTTYMKSIVWKSANHRIFSNDSVMSVNGKRVTYGTGFESDENFTTPLIRNQRGTVVVDD